KDWLVYNFTELASGIPKSGAHSYVLKTLIMPEKNTRFKLLQDKASRHTLLLDRNVS
ncbi:19511_t:CDS:2, partial [Racocetra persica]